MPPIPRSYLTGHKRLHDRAVAALSVCQESQDVDFKESAGFDAIWGHIVHSALAMGNLRDGGLIVVGVSQRGDEWELTGISAEHLATYDVDVVIAKINSYVSPYVEVDVVLLTEIEKDFLVLGVREFRDTPLVAKKNGPDGSGIKEGCVYVRPPGMARTSVVTNANQMHELLELAAEKRARRLLETARRVGMVEPPDSSSAELFRRELGGL
jgi:predicted HTH transcriptional regulator